MSRKRLNLSPDEHAKLMRHVLNLAAECCHPLSLFEIFDSRRKNKGLPQFRRKMDGALRDSILVSRSGDEVMMDTIVEPSDYWRPLSTTEIGWLLSLDHSAIVAMRKKAERKTSEDKEAVP